MKKMILNFVIASAFIVSASSLHAQDWSTSGNSGGANEKLGTTTSHPLKLITDNVTRFIIKPDGNVGIGTDKTTGYKLSVDGLVRAREVVVNLDVWADFVFNPSYALRPLDSLSNYLSANRKLPEIPSEATVKEEGIPIGEMNRLLLMKVEELHLYILQLHNRMKEIESRNGSGTTTSTQE